jgi:hypothetical protein
MQAPPAPFSQSAKDVHLLIETDRTTYTLGDTVRLRLSLINTSDKPIQFTPFGPWDMARLIITGPDGKVIPTGDSRRLLRPASGW